MGLSASRESDKSQTNTLLDKSMKSQDEYKCSQMNVPIELEPEQSNTEIEEIVNDKPSKLNVDQWKTMDPTPTPRRHSVSGLPKKLKSTLKLKNKAKTMSMNNIDKFITFVRNKHQTSQSQFEMYNQLDPESRTVTELTGTTDDFLLISLSDDTSQSETSNNETSNNDISQSVIESNETELKIAELWIFNMCLWTDDEIEEFLKLVGSQKYFDTFKSNAIKANHLMIMDKETLQSMNIPSTHCQNIIKERDWFLKCNESIQTLMDLNVSNCNRNRLETILNDIKSILNTSTVYAIKNYSKKNIFENKYQMMVKIIQDYIQQIDNQLKK